MTASELSFVFVITYGRSGSTVTQNLLNSLPGWCIRGENANAAYGLCRSFATLQSEHNLELRKRNHALPEAERGPRMRVVMGKPIDPWFGAELIDLDGYAQALRAAFVENILNPPTGTQVTGFKEIRIHNDRAFAPDYLSTLRVLFPGAKFIFQKRNHDDVLKSGWWPKKDPIPARNGFEFADTLFDDFMRQHPDCSHILHYDQLRQGAAALGPLFAFLDVPFDSDRIDAVLSQRLDHMKG